MSLPSRPTRRNLLATGAIGLPLGAVAAACSGGAVEPVGRRASARPAVPSKTSRPGGAPREFGPNGTRWPADTPRPRDARVRLDVGCSWSEIDQAVRRLTPDQVARGVHLRVARGILPGYGAGSGDRPVLMGTGDPTWSRNVLISPRDGYGSVRVATDPERPSALGGIRLDQVSRLTLSDLDGSRAYVCVTASRSLRLARSRYLYLSPTFWHDDLHLVELVLGFGSSGDVNPDNADVFAARPLGPPPTDLARAGCSISQILIDGCHFKPAYRAPSSGAHTDTLQFEISGGRPGAKPIKRVTLRDTVVFTSSSQGIIAPDVDDLIIEHSFLVGARQTQQYYPSPRGKESGFARGRGYEASVTNGLGRRATVNDSLVTGVVRRAESISSVRNSRIPQPPRERPRKGSWTRTPAMDRWDAEKLSSLITPVDPGSLKRIWAS